MYFTQLFLYPHCEGAVVAAHFSSECHFKLDFLANPPSADTMVWSLLQESPSLWHFMTTRHGQKMTSASRRERGSRLSTARKLQLLISLSTLRRNASLREDGASYLERRRQVFR